MGKKLQVYYCNKYKYYSPNCVFTRLGLTYRSILSDRFNFLNKYSHWNIETFDDPLPKVNTKLDYKEICLSRGKELAEQYPDGIAIAYSGGTDSLGMVAVLLLVGYPLDKIHIIGNSHSINENLYAYDFLVKNKVKVTISRQFEYMSHFDNIPERVILTGHCNDQFFHVGTVYENLDKQVAPIEDGLRWLYAKEGFEGYLDFDLDLIQQYSKLVGWEVHDLFDLSVLINFGCRYKFVQNHFGLHTLNKETAGKFLSFYDNQDFQDWALTNREQNKEYYKLSLSNNEFYKKPLKELIYKVYGKEDSIVTKGKESSWGKRMRLLWCTNRLPFIFSYLDSEGFHVKWYKPTLEPKQVKKVFNSFFNEFMCKRNGGINNE